MENMVTIPLSVFMEGDAAINTLQTIRDLVQSGEEYCSDSISVILGLPTKKERENNEGA